MRIFNAIIAGLAGVAMLYGAAAAAMTGYLKIPDIDGESASRYDGGQFEIESFSWGATASGAARPAGKGPGVVVVRLDGRSSAPAPLRALYDGGKKIPSMTLTTTENGKTVEYKLERCFIKSWSTSGDADDRPTEEVAFYYNKIAF